MIKLALACLVLASCSARAVPSMHAITASTASSPPPAGPGQASVVFVRPPSSCDSIDYTTIVDENGHFVGSAGGSTAFLVNVPAGRHVFYAWSHIEMPPDRYYAPINAVALDLSEGSVAHVEIRTAQGPGLRCYAKSLGYALVPRDDSDAARAEFESWRRDATPLEPDVEAGERDLNETRSVVCSHIEAVRGRVHAPPPASCAVSTR
jgi:hypothetical protein